MEELAVYVASSAFDGPGFHRSGWRDALHDVLARDEGLDDEQRAFLSKTRYLPDGWCYLDLKSGAPHESLHALEVEDTSKLCRDKMAWYAYLWEALDNVEVCLWVCDRYGLNLRRLPLDIYADCIDMKRGTLSFSVGKAVQTIE